MGWHQTSAAKLHLLNHKYLQAVGINADPRSSGRCCRASCGWGEQWVAAERCQPLPRWQYLCSLQKCCCRAEGRRSPPARPRPAPLHSAAEQNHTAGLRGFSVLWHHPCSFNCTQQTLLEAPWDSTAAQPLSEAFPLEMINLPSQFQCCF